MSKTTKNKIVYEQNINGINGKSIAIVFPDTDQEIKNIIKLGESDVIARGAGSSFTGGVIPKNSVIIDFSKMNKIININPGKKTAIVEPGVLLSELNEELESYGLEFPIIPLFSGIETIGGLIAKNSAGNREIKYNHVINWIDSLEVINGKGEQIKISKSDLSDFAGMEGTTGLIVKATLRLTNKKQKSLTILKAGTIEDVFVANRKLRLNQDVSAIDLINREISSLLGLENKYHIFVELENSRGSFKGAEYERLMKLKEKAYKKAATEGFYHMENVKFLIDSLQDFLIYLEEKRIPYFSHLASGAVYPLFRPEEKEKLEEMLKFARRLRGRIAYNFGAGLTRKDFIDVGEREIMRRVKNRHDPQDRLNSGKLIDSSISAAKMKLESEAKAAELAEKAALQEEAEVENIEESLEQAENKETENEKAEEIQAEEKTEQKTEEKTDKPLTVGDVLQEMQKSEQITLKKNEPELSPEEKEKIKKLASGFFAGGRDIKEEQK